MADTNSRDSDDVQIAYRSRGPKERERPDTNSVLLTCPACGTNTKASKDNLPTLPDECKECEKRQMARQVDALDSDQAIGASQQEIAAIQANVSKLQGEQRKQGAEMLAMRGDLADIRLLLKQVLPDLRPAVREPAKGRKAKG